MIVVVENVGAVVVHIGLRLSFAGMPQDVAMVKGGMVVVNNCRRAC